MRSEADRIRRKLMAPPGMSELPPAYPQDLSDFTKRLWKRCGPYTMTSIERIATLEYAVRHIARHRIPGAVIECGVACGGSMMAAAVVLQELGDTDRDLYLFDTFAGMSEPTEHDISVRGKKAMVQYRKKRTADGKSNWIVHSQDEVASTMALSGYDPARIRYIEGMVEDTLPTFEIDKIALLRLDTDWYESTKIEMETLFPKLQEGGLLILDDYNRWLGSRKAVDDYLAEHDIRMFLARVDDHAAIGVVPRATAS